MASIPIYSATLIEDPQDGRLHVKSKKVKEIRSPKVWATVDRMKFIMKQEGGIGLAANQIGVNLAIIVVLNDATGEITEFINPRLSGGTPQSNENVYWAVEGCLSHKGIYGEVARYRTIEFVAQRLKDSKEHVFRASGMVARIIQHEIDHVNGQLFTDLGPEVRNISFDLPGQVKLLEATAKTMAEGQRDFVAD